MKKGKMEISNEITMGVETIGGTINQSSQENDKKHIRNKKAFLTALPILSLLEVTLLGVARNASGMDTIKMGILTFILTAAAIFFIQFQEDDFLNKPYAKSIILISYLGSLGLIMIPFSPELFSFWMLGALLVAMIIDSRLGMLFYFNLTFILGISISLRPETTIQLLIMGILMGLLSTSLKQKATVIYAGIIILSTNITLAFIINNFVFETGTNYNYITSFFSIFAVLVTAFLLSSFYFRLTKDIVPVIKEEKENETVAEVEPEVAAGKVSGEVTMMMVSETQEALDTQPYDRDVRTSYELLLGEGNEILLRMKEFSETLYSHCIMIGELSFKAAKEIGADEMLAKAGGIYHEAGKINGKNYIEEGLKLADEYSFPKELRVIMKQHNIKYEKPTSVEAAIVMLSDNVVSTIDYIKKTGDKKYTVEKIIDNIFKMRMDKGTFDESGISVKDYKILKEFYMNEFKHMEI
ncbi:HDIG domain-containing protein [Mobilitalea sibirica]|uniref:HDIG domain-containing protein n=1 Tax=Mobilitalea sibirica TaxID=1462919 RepID=A0A8J7HBT3_9FIRM|nr:HDIG domain-containing metalloprotein [Mobilitalea sibirica]MBH1941456.1 HDIG domain-containing protein [Mobilitalea sibirica]